MKFVRLARAGIFTALSAACFACADSAELLSSADARAPTATVVDAQPALAIPAVTGAWWTYAVEHVQANHHSIERVELGVELEPGRFALKASILAANGAALVRTFPYASWMFRGSFEGTTLTGEDVVFFAPGRLWSGPGIAGQFALADRLGSTEATASYGGAAPRPTRRVARTDEGVLPPSLGIEEHYALGVGFVGQAAHRCADATCVDSTITLLSWSFTQPSSVADRRCREDLSGVYDNGVSLTQRGTTIAGEYDMRTGASGWSGTITGTRTTNTVSLRYALKDASGTLQDYVVDYEIGPSGLALESKVPASPLLIRACPPGELR
jgi:hypothetical protein